LGWNPPPVTERFMSKIDFRSSDKGCWIWKGNIDRPNTPFAYGRFWYNRTTVMAHRFSFEIIGKRVIPADYQIDHLCKNSLCVKPEHLEAVSQKENSNRSNNPMAINSRKTHCLNGHELVDENLYIASDGHRKCYTCIKIRAKQFRENNKERLKTIQKEWYEENKEELKLKHKIYWENNKDWLNAWQRDYKIQKKVENSK
jgi:hypothetical protein